MFQVLSNQHYQHRTNHKLPSWRTQFFKIVGFAGKCFLLSPPPPPPLSFLFFCSHLNFSRRTHVEKLATQATSFAVVAKMLV